MSDNGSKMFLGVVLGSLATQYYNSSSPSSTKGLEQCIHAYYADKYNGVSHGSPPATFMTCVAAQNKDLFEKIKGQYKKEPSSS